MSSRSMADRSNSRPLWRPGLIGRFVLAGLMLALGGTVSAHADVKAPSVCLDRANPFHKIDHALAEAVGRLEGHAPRFVTIDTRDGSDALNAKRPSFFSNLTKRCDLVMGFPVESGYPTLPPGVKATRSYAKTGFVIAGFDAPPPFAKLAPHTLVGVVYLTVPTTYFGTGTGARLDEHEYSAPDDLMTALERHQITYALVWQPSLERALARHPSAIRERQLDTPHAHWSIVALYAPTQDGRRAARKFDAAIGDLARTGRLATLVAPYSSP